MLSEVGSRFLAWTQSSKTVLMSPGTGKRLLYQYKVLHCQTSLSIFNVFNQ